MKQRSNEVTSGSRKATCLRVKQRSNEATNGRSTPRCSPKLTRYVTAKVQSLSSIFCKSLKGKRLESRGLMLEGGEREPAAVGDQETQESQVRERHLGHPVPRKPSLKAR